MNDEATAYYSDMIDQLSLGLRFIKEEFGDCVRPRVAWYICFFVVVVHVLKSLQLLFYRIKNLR